jgi:L-iditol 2-dehydrogenase
MLAAVFPGNGEIELKEVADPSPRADEVTIRVMAASISDSDVELRHGRFPSRYPIVAGHEFSGDVVELGERVTGLEEGIRVVVEPHTGCGICPNCKRGYFSYCINYGTSLNRTIGFTVNGGFAEYVTVPATSVHKLPADVKYETGALLSCAAAPLLGLEEVGVEAGDTAVVLGAGPIGLISTQILKAKGSKEAILAGGTRKGLEIAPQLGANKVIDAGRSDVAQIVNQITNGMGADLVVETSGSIENLNKSTEIVRRAGRILLLGSYRQRDGLINPDRITRNGLTVKGSGGESRGVLPRVIRLHAAERLKLEPLITHEFALREIGKAFDHLEEASGDTLKVILRVEDIFNEPR